MFTRLFNRSGAAYRPGHLDPADWKTFDFGVTWKNLQKAYNIRVYHNEIAPPFSKDVTKRAIELEELHDDIQVFQLSRTHLHFLVWVLFTGFLIDYEAFDRPLRHPLVEDRANGTNVRTRMTFMLDDA